MTNIGMIFAAWIMVPICAWIGIGSNGAVAFGCASGVTIIVIYNHIATKKGWKL